MNAPKIIVNGIELTNAQSMTIHVALQSFAIDLIGDDTLADVRQLYLNNIKDITAIYLTKE